MLSLSKNSIEEIIFGFTQENKEFFERMSADMLMREKLFEKINNARIRTALENFSPDMKLALFEVLFFLHTNHSRFADYRYQIYKSPEENKKPNEEAEISSSDLYVPGAAEGVLGIDNLNHMLKDSFAEYCDREFNIPYIGKQEHTPFLSICSIGSVGTIAHKPDKSDLDIQVQYDLFPSYAPEGFIWHDNIVKLMGEMEELLAEEHGQEGEDGKRVLAGNFFENYIKKYFPGIGRYISSYERKEEFDKSPALIGQLLLELEKLYRVHYVLSQGKELKQKELLIQQKIKRISDHLSKKFPYSDIFFFPYTTDNYRRGQHGTTKKNKEASGSAYELILNYETLLPGIQFNSAVPTHFLYNNEVNRSPGKYAYFMSMVKLGIHPKLNRFKKNTVDLGHTPYISKDYVVEHFGAVYWEAFKASQGNLAKAFLNLLRIEIMLWKDESPTVINCIKDRSMYSVERKKDNDEFGLNILPSKTFNQQDIAEAEVTIPNLIYDPWWIRYKILKYSYENPPGVISVAESRQILRMIDICFAIHIMMAEVIDEENYGTKNVKISYRYNFLRFFYNNAFPLFSQNRDKINRIFAGDTDEIRTLEKEMKSLFYHCIQRVEFRSKISSGKLTANREEFEIWYHYFKRYFNPPPNMIPLSILKHHKQRRNRLVIIYRDKLWFFTSIYEKETKLNEVLSMADKQGKVELFRHSSFLFGFAYCILNNYFFVNIKGSIRKTLSTVEVNFSGYNEQKDKIISRLPQDGADRIGRFILEKFSPFPVNYRDAMNPNNPVHDMCIFLNMMVFGRIDILYRDTLNNWYYTSMLADNVRAKSKQLFDSPEEFLNSHEIFAHIHTFCTKSNVRQAKGASNIHVWVNPVSLNMQGSPEHKQEYSENKFKSNYINYTQLRLNNNTAETPANGTPPDKNAVL